jgi:drug/metabolite transporter (DMT)-like permease
MLKIIGLTGLAMLAFAANSVLARQALGGGEMDPAGFTAIRLLAGAATLALLVGFARAANWRQITSLGTWQQAAALFGYALAFSLAYVLLGAGMGALVLFVSVQFGMIARGLFAGDRPGALEWLGLVVALGAFVYLISPGLSAPDPLGTVLMVISGLCWAAYSLLGRRSSRPLADAAGSFVRCVPFAIILLGLGLAWQVPSPAGVGLAIASGAITSGLGYAIWYAVLPLLTRTRAAIVQLSVPVIAAIIAVPVLGEAVTPRLLIASLVILGGIAIAILGAGRRRTV